MINYLLWIALLLGQTSITFGYAPDSVKEQPNAYVGSDQCEDCHQQQTELWKQSHHFNAMSLLSEQPPLGNFDDASLVSDQRKARFFKKGNAFLIDFDEPDQAPKTYPIKYSFGFYPLQQYMIEFPDGRIQLLPFAWDSRPASEGGQRWFDLYPDQTQPHQEFYWKNTGQNWNFMCADCHSTNVSKNFDLAKNHYNTNWQEINVACEACHGPAKAHIDWTKQATKSVESVNLTNKGFDRSLSKAVVEWIKDPDQATLQPKKTQDSDQTLVCAQCHSRHTQISEKDHIQNQSFHDRYLLSFINQNNYYPDGQIYDEVFVYGSYLQSKMHQKGVVCSNCHEPHSGKVIAEDNSLCLQCHTADTYNQTSHHFHQTQSEGAACVSCHMPETTYMQVDDRADHSWPIPRPDHALKFGTPDTCLNCHQDKDSHWSNQQVQRWYPNSTIRARDHFVEAFAMADSQFPNANQELPKIAQDKRYPSIIRASALDRMQAYPDNNTLISIARAVRDPDELVRLGAAQASQNIPFEHIWPVLSELLKDSVLAVRSETANVLAQHWQQMSKQQQQRMKPALKDFFTVQSFNADRGFSHANMANIYVWQGKFDDALNALNQSIRIEPNFEPAYINKADLLRNLGRADEELNTLKSGINANPDGASLHYALALNRIRAKDKKQAQTLLAKATQLAPNNANFHYVFGISLEDNIQGASQAFQKAYQLSNNPRHLYALCELQVRHKTFQAQNCLDQLSTVAPAQVVDELRKQLQ